MDDEALLGSELELLEDSDCVACDFEEADSDDSVDESDDVHSVLQSALEVAAEEVFNHELSDEVLPEDESLDVEIEESDKEELREEERVDDSSSSKESSEEEDRFLYE